MAIINSTIIEDRAQANGQRWIRERHTDDTGLTHDYVWMAEPGQATATILASRAAWLGTWLRDQEIERVIWDIENGTMPTAPRYNTLAQVGVALREAYRTLSGAAVAHAARWALTRTDTELKAWFGGLTTPQLTALKTRLTNRVAALDALNALAGE